MRLAWMPVVGAIGLAVSSLATAADSFTVGVLSCAAETDRDRRLDCYDRQVAGYTAGLARGGSAVAAASAAKPGAAGPTAAATPSPRSAALAATGVAAAPTSVASTGGNPVASASVPTPAGTADAGRVQGTATPSAPRHYAGHVASIEHFPDYVVVHLDNQQTWKQVSESPGGDALRTGDAVTIDKQMGSWWLAGPKGEAVQVKLEGPKS